MGASASAATWRTQATSATPKPIVHHLEGNSPVGARERVADVDVGRRDGAPVLPQEGEVGREGATKGKQQSDLNAHLSGEESGGGSRAAGGPQARCSRFRPRTLRA